jgi:anaerobic magnesium-protoporphyrin IX monomethyl ester cyclase
MKVLFLNANLPFVTEENGTSNRSTLGDRVMPYSLLTGAAYFRAAGITVQVHDAVLTSDSDEETVRRVSSASPDMVVITANVLGLHPLERLLTQVKDAARAPIVVWFNEPFAEDFVRRLRHADFCIEHNWYAAALELCKSLQSGAEPDAVPGHYALRKGLVVHSGSGPHLPITMHPAPALDLVDARRYDHQQALFSEGCRYRCFFCHFGPRGGCTWRSKTIDAFVEELGKLRSCGRKFIRIIDNELTQDAQTAKELMRRIIAEKLDIVWETNVRVSNVDEDLIRLMAEAGCLQVGFGVESGVQQILDINDKQISLEQVLRTRAWLRKHRIVSRAYFLVGLRGDTRETIARTFDFVVKEVRAESSSFDLVVPYAGTPYHDYLRQRGLLDTVTVENILWLHRNLYGADFIDERWTCKPSWHYDNLRFDEVVDVMSDLYGRIRHSNLSLKVGTVLARGPRYYPFLAGQLLRNPTSLFRKLRSWSS